MNLTDMPIMNGSRTCRGGLWAVGSVLHGRSQLSPSKTGGRGQHWRGSCGQWMCYLGRVVVDASEHFGCPRYRKNSNRARVVRKLKCMANRMRPTRSHTSRSTVCGYQCQAQYMVYFWEAISGHDTATDGHLHLNSKVALKHLSRRLGVSDLFVMLVLS